MATVTVYATGDEIGTYSSWSMSGNNNGVKLQLYDVETLGSSTDVFKIVITQVNSGTDEFSNGQWVSIYAHPEADPPEPAIFSNLNPQHDQFQGRASSGEHQVFTNSANIVFDINGLSEGTVQYGPGIEPDRSDQLGFDSFSSSPPVFPCFVAGTLIETDTGPLPVEALRAGDLVKTVDNGLQPLIWAGCATVDGRDDAAPIRIAAGALGNYRDLYVSPHHRMMLQSWEADLHFGAPDCLVPAKFLVDGDQIRRAPRASVTYCHLLCDHHQMIFAEGIPTETLHMGNVSKDILGPTALAEIRALRPDLSWTQPTARRCIKAWESPILSRIYDSKTGVLSSAA